MTRVARRLGTAAVLAVLVVAFAAWWVAAVRHGQVRRSAPTLVAVAKPMPAAAARALAAELGGRIAAAPLDQDLVNRYYTVAAVNGLWTTEQRDAWRTQLGALGWRGTAAQQNLMYDAALRSDFATLLDRGDAMLRRDKLVSELLFVMSAVEQAPQTHERLVTRLAAQVPWRRGFLTDARGVQSAEGRSARLDTVERLIRTRRSVERDEIAPLIAAEAAAEGSAAAHPLWARYRAAGGGSVPRPGSSFDATFAFAAAAQRAGSQAAIPFEWQSLSGETFSADVATDGVTLRWDGNGVPVLLRQTFAAVPGRYMLIIQGLDVGPELLNTFDISLDCGDQQALFTRPRPRDAGTLVVETSEALQCRFPTLTVRGRPDMVARAVDATLTSMSVRVIGA